MLLVGGVDQPGQNLSPVLPCIIIMYFRRMFVALIQRNMLTVGSTEAGDYFSTVKDCVVSESSFDNRKSEWNVNLLQVVGHILSNDRLFK